MTDIEKEPTYADLMRQHLDGQTTAVSPLMDAILDLRRPGTSPELVEARIRAKGFAVTKAERLYEDENGPIDQHSNVVLVLTFDDASCLVWNLDRDIIVNADSHAEAWATHEDVLIDIAEIASDPYPEREWPSVEGN